MLQAATPEFSMNRRLLTLLMILSCGAPAVTTGAELTEVAVLQLIASVDRAIVARDVDGVGAALSEDINITVNSSISGQLQRVSLTKAEYLRFLQQAWSAATDYRYRRSNQKILLRGDRAVVTADVWESMTMDGRAYVTNTQETTTVEVVGGKLLATAISAISSE